MSNRVVHRAVLSRHRLVVDGGPEGFLSQAEVVKKIEKTSLSG